MDEQNLVQTCDMDPQNWCISCHWIIDSWGSIILSHTHIGLLLIIYQPQGFYQWRIAGEHVWSIWSVFSVSGTFIWCQYLGWWTEGCIVLLPGSFIVGNLCKIRHKLYRSQMSNYMQSCVFVLLSWHWSNVIHHSNASNAPDIPNLRWVNFHDFFANGNNHKQQKMAIFCGPLLAARPWSGS